MTVKEVMEILEKCNPADEVVLSSDAEGNGFSLCEEITSGRYESYGPGGRFGEFGEGEGAICFWPL